VSTARQVEFDSSQVLFIDANLAEFDPQVGSARPLRRGVKSFEGLFDPNAKCVSLSASRLEVPSVRGFPLAQAPAEVFEARGEVDRRGG
jgi:hypothetical protein